MLFFYSAAKAPYLARFRVNRCGIKELETTALTISNQQVGKYTSEEDRHLNSVGIEHEMWQAAIFKVNHGGLLS